MFMMINSRDRGEEGKMVGGGGGGGVSVLASHELS